MFPYKTSLKLNKNLKEPLYLQLANQFILLIREGNLPPGTKLVGSRTLADLLQVHRKTVVACYEELLLQGWVESIPKKGTFVNKSLPLAQKTTLVGTFKTSKKKSSGFNFYDNNCLSEKKTEKRKGVIYINDGTSDTRLTPTEEIARIYRKIASKKSAYTFLDYSSTHGNVKLREVLAVYLNNSRGLKISKENILITRGSQMGMWLSSQLLLKEGDIIVVGETNYSSADITFQYQKAQIKRVSVDENGLVIDQIEKLCKKQSIKAVYVTSHHHHPTTVTLSAERRIHLLNLAQKHNFAIIEDDYDYDFNYNHAPILPLASHDSSGNVIYIGSVCKTVAPVFRVGYLVASEDFVNEAAKLRGYVDRQGDALLELTFAEFIKSGDLDRHIRKLMKIYLQRRDLFCELLKNKLGDYFQFEVPKGGMAIWVHLNKQYSWSEVAKEASKHQLEVGEWQRYDLVNKKHNAIRIGFASYNDEEIKLLIEKLKQTFKSIKKVPIKHF
ncbi:PLP-dependent aminotransferase family protein [Tenacibaculum singaporense]|uniref:PLP-dependent aminotransferase family protein n=1 Tax=Tenacibaculum singaporense TaxID=2358479 RepID=A0A3Q8RSM6_9FLAO|nr:PLP-dependent aminotransferase family protein [Tenacibaculum singaporense]AZJ35782.1 PLP-dependent aminotransferase family protein [Tenacibaculum singaporense]